VYCSERTKKAEHLDGRKAIRAGKAERVKRGKNRKRIKLNDKESKKKKN
jgi:hypothetical protein